MDVTRLPFVSGSQETRDLNYWDIPAEGVEGEMLSATGRRYGATLAHFMSENEAPFILGHVVQEMLNRGITMGPIEVAFFNQVGLSALLGTRP